MAKWLLLTVMATGLLAGLGWPGALAVLTDQETVADDTFLSDDCFPNNNTGLLNPSAEAADTGGDGDGYEVNPTNAFGDGGTDPNYFARSVDGEDDRHRYYDYGFSIDSSCVIAGIEVRLDWWLSTTLDANSMDVELSWDGGTSWTAAKTDAVESTSEHTTTLGASADTWGHAWTATELSNVNFRVRLTSNCSNTIFFTCAFRDFFLDWVPVNVYYGPAGGPTDTPTNTPTPGNTNTPTTTNTPTNTPTPGPSVSRANAWTTGLTHTAGSGSNRVIMFVAAYESAADPGVSSITYGGQDLTFIVGEVSVATFYARVELWYIDEAGIAAASGNTFAVTWGGSSPGRQMFAAATYEDVNQSTPISDSSSAQTGSSTPNPLTTDVTVANGSMAVGAAIAGSDGSYSWNNGWTEGTDQTSESSTTMSSADHPAVGGGTDTASATHSGPNRQAIVAAVLAP